MTHRVTYTVINPPPGQTPVALPLTYSDSDYQAMFSAEDRATLAAGGMVIAKGAINTAWIGDVGIKSVRDDAAV